MAGLAKTRNQRASLVNRIRVGDRIFTALVSIAVFAAAVLLAVFAAYLNPHFVFDVANAVWACF